MAIFSSSLLFGCARRPSNLQFYKSVWKGYSTVPANRVHILSVDFNNKAAVDHFLLRLTEDEKKKLTLALAENSGIVQPVIKITPLGVRALCLVALSNGLPFIGFGFLDNSLMIIAGESIENTWGAMMGISTMAAAALGNWVSDVVGLGTAGYVESVCHRIGIRPPEMSPQQMDSFSTRLFVVLGRCIGISIGCFLGMIPLLFFDKKSDAEK